MDLIYPEGYGEALSGGEREPKKERILERIEEQELDLENFEYYLKMVDEGIPDSGGFGMGVERLTRFICGLEEIMDTRLFPKPPGSAPL